MNVPGHDGRKGFGGACFPKDSLALIKYAESIDVRLNTLISTVKINNKIRSGYEELDARESEQNVSFDDKIWFCAQVVKLVDTRDLKSLEGNFVPVQVRPWAPVMVLSKNGKYRSH